MTRLAVVASCVVFFSSCPAHAGGEDGPVAQLVAHLHGMQGVRGSSPLRSTMKKPSGNRGLLAFPAAIRPDFSSSLGTCYGGKDAHVRMSRERLFVLRSHA